MKRLKSFFFVSAVVSLLLISCSKDEDLTNGTIEFTGLIQTAQITSYQYGTHTLTTDAEVYALRSSAVDLADFVGRTETVVAVKIEGYPIDGGPEFLEVTEMK